MSFFVLISPAHPRINNDNLDPPLGLMYLSAVLREAGHQVEILDFAGSRRHQVPEADVYGFTTYTPTYWWSLKKRDEIRAMYPQAKFIAGGTHVSALPEECAADWDCVVVGEGETGILEIAENGISEKVLYSQSIMNVDSIPFPDYGGVDVSSYDRELLGRQSHSILSSRGCPYRCAFCNSIIWNGARKVRFRDPAEVSREILYLQDSFNATRIRFIDDLFAISEKRVEKLTNSLRPLGIKYRCTGRCNTFTKDMAQRLSDSGCVQVEFGVESGSDAVLQRMNKKQRREDIRRALWAARSCGLQTRVYLIVGFPGETWGTVKETCDLILECGPDEVLIHTVIPFPGTALYQNPEEFGITWISEDFKDYMQISRDRKSYYLMSHQTASKDDIREMWEYTCERLSSLTWYNGRK